jgi:hypothetical protein
VSELDTVQIIQVKLERYEQGRIIRAPRVTGERKRKNLLLLSRFPIARLTAYVFCNVSKFVKMNKPSPHLVPNLKFILGVL